MYKTLLTFIFFSTSWFFFAQDVNKISVQAAKHDVNDLIATIESVHYNPFHRIDKFTLIRIKDSIFREWSKDSISYREFTKSGMYLTSLMSNGHTSFDWQNPALFPELISSSFLPLKVKIKEDELIVTSSSCNDIKEGDIITSINNQNAVALFRKVMSLTGGIEAFKEVISEKFFPLYLFFFIKENNSYKIKMKTGDEKLIKGISIQEVINFLQSDINRKNYVFKIIDEDIGLISYNKCEDYNAFSRFLDSTFYQISSKNLDKLIIDLRYNSGGNSSLNDQLLSYITKKKYRQSSGRYWKVSKEVKQKIKNDSLWQDFLDQDFLELYKNSKDQSSINAIDYTLTKNDKPLHFFNGKHCFIIGPYTFSSANYLADAIKTFSLSTLVGKSTGEFTNDFGEQVEFQLSRSKSYFFLPTTYDIGANKIETIMTPVIPDIYVDKDELEAAIKFLNKKK